LARTDFRAAAARRLSEERELSPAIVSLLSNDRQGRPRGGIRNVDVDRIEPNPEQPRLAFDETSLEELAASIREHGVLQPILVRPLDGGDYQLIAGERRWRASRAAGLQTIPALVEEIDDDTALEISIIENLQREDLSPLDEAAMYDRMVRDHGYSVRRLAQKLGKDKGYLENRLRLADAPEEIRELVSLRKDTLSHAYELLKVDDPKRRKRLAAQVARGELTLIKLRDRIEGRPSRSSPAGPPIEDEEIPETSDEMTDEAEAAWTGKAHDLGPSDLADDALVSAKTQLADAVEAFMDVLKAPGVVREISAVDRANLAKYLLIAKLRLENAIAVVRSEGA
jgi:ParB family chromosome partitioning protein